MCMSEGIQVTHILSWQDELEWLPQNICSCHQVSTRWISRRKFLAIILKVVQARKTRVRLLASGIIFHEEGYFTSIEPFT